MIAGLYVYNLTTGEPAITCMIPDGVFVNDVYADYKYTYYTDSGRGVVYNLDLMKSNSTDCVIKELSLPPEFIGEGFRASVVPVVNIRFEETKTISIFATKIRGSP